MAGSTVRFASSARRFLRASSCPAAVLGLWLAAPAVLDAQKPRTPPPSSSSAADPDAALESQRAGQTAESSSSNDTPDAKAPRPVEEQGPAARPRAAQLEPGGASVTLETSEPLFDVAAALNVCGFDQGLDRAAPVRAAVRAELTRAINDSEAARSSRDALCEYIAQHQQRDAGLNVGQYVSLALYLSPPPELTPNVDIAQLPPQAASVVNVLPRLRTFAQDVDLHVIWLRHRAEYEALSERVRDPMRQMIQNTRIYLHLPMSTYDGRRFLVLLEPMLAPQVTNARIYGTDYILETSPDNSAGDPVRMEEIRHIYLHYVVEPLVYSRGSAMERIQPILRGVQDAPVEFFYKSDAPALLTECLIKAIEAHLYEVPGPKPQKPKSVHERTDLDLYQAEKVAWDKANDLARLKLVDTDEAQGWVLTTYFYNELSRMQHAGDGLPDEMAQMIYGMDVQRELHHALQILFVKTQAADPLSPSSPRTRTLTPMDRAEILLLQGKVSDAEELSTRAMDDPRGDHARAQYTLARIDLMQGDPEKATAGFENAIKLSQASTAPDQRTMAWSHIYLGRLYDTQVNPPERSKAMAEYRAALAVRDERPDTRMAAEAGLAKPYKLPQRAQATPQKRAPDDDDPDFDPTGKKEKDSYRPDDEKPASSPKP